MAETPTKTVEDYRAEYLRELAAITDEQLASAYAKSKEGREQYFAERKLRKTEVSPSGKYRFDLYDCETKPGCWGYTAALVYEGERKIAEVKRNYGSFPFGWVEGHAKGDFLLCGEDYQGQTAINLRTGERRDYVPKEWMKGHGFCWVSIRPSPDAKYVAVEGCVWACPYELVVYDLSDPMNLPYSVIDSIDDFWEFERWNSDGSISYAESVRDVRLSDGKLIDDLPQEEWPDDDDWGDLKTMKTWMPKKTKEKTDANQN